jgi:hypothetical protein
MPSQGKPETGMVAAVMGRDDRPGHPLNLRAREPRALTLVASLCSTEPLSLQASSLYRCLPCQRVNLPTCQLICLSLFHRASGPPGLSCATHVNVSTCQLVPSRLRRAHLCTGASLRFAPLHFGLRSTEPLSLRASSLYRCLPCQRVNLPTCQLICLSLFHRASGPPGL